MPACWGRLFLDPVSPTNSRSCGSVSLRQISSQPASARAAWVTCVHETERQRRERKPDRVRARADVASAEPSARLRIPAARGIR